MLQLGAIYMSGFSSDHSASYDSHGDIILGPMRISQDSRRREEKAAEPAHHEHVHVTQREPRKDYVVRILTPPERAKSFIDKTRTMVISTVDEGKAQLFATAEGTRSGLAEARHSLRELPARILRSFKTTWKLMLTPVTLPFRKSTRPKTRLELFAVDTLRFGGTFAAIFGLLFVGINYQSFLSIAKAQLALGDDIHTEQALEKMGGSELGIHVPFIKTRALAGLIGYLPEVGPFEDRVVIPKLGKNVPIVRPSMDALMKEDWIQFEEDIQTALHDGVVHYPGSARPGQAGNFFLTGHSSYYPWDNGKYKDVFARLSELETGDTYFVYYGGDKHIYRVLSKREVRPTDTTVLDQPADRRLATLMTCTPVGTTLRRLIVLSEEIDPSTGLALKVGETASEKKDLPFSKLNALPI